MPKEKIKLIADSTIDLSPELIQELEVEVVPLIVSYDQDSDTFLDGETIHPKDIIEHVSKTGKLPITSAVGPGVYENIFNEWINAGYTIIFTGIGSKLSANLNSALIGKNACVSPDKVTLIDSNNLSSASGLVLLKIRDMIKEGLSRDEIKEKCDRDITPNLRSSFCIDTTDYLVKGGRCSAITGLFAKLLYIKPIIKVMDGKLVIGKKPMGSLNNAVYTIYLDMMKEITDIDPTYLMITHFDSDNAEAYIEDVVKKTCNFKHIYNTHAGCVISSHCGPGTIGLLYLVKPEKKE